MAFPTSRHPSSYCLAAGNPGAWTGPGNNTYLFDGEEPTLLDAGVGHQAHVDAVAAHLNGRALVRILVTHGHPDHASGVPALRARWPNLKAFKWLDQPGPGVTADSWSPLADGERVRAGDIWLTTIHTPGHAADHVCFWETDSRELYCGDMMTATTTILIPPASRGGSLKAYLASLHRLAALQPDTSWPGHGPVIDAPVRRIQEYLTHRAEREREVLACLEDGVTGLDEIVSRVYVETPQNLWPAARLTVEALFEKLHEEGRL
ncbi:MAG: MBL fold metallo-hydrolase [Acidobacteria bacterium]|jgi:glyoxylase-like metal-dependent hydrolase (beta-lactamase superfamily II)|nr:MBL fold metallo-hydrolase [Acidobacteriota bacterium]